MIWEEEIQVLNFHYSIKLASAFILSILFQWIYYNLCYISIQTLESSQIPQTFSAMLMLFLSNPQRAL